MYRVQLHGIWRGYKSFQYETHCTINRRHSKCKYHVHILIFVSLYHTSPSQVFRQFLQLWRHLLFILVSFTTKFYSLSALLAVKYYPIQKLPHYTCRFSSHALAVAFAVSICKKCMQELAANLEVFPSICTVENNNLDLFDSDSIQCINVWRNCS